jgi:hypothetical protein
MPSDPFFDSLIAYAQRAGTFPDGGDPTLRDHELDDQAQQEGDVDEWFERAASGSREGVVDALLPADQLGAAALPLDVDLVRPHARYLTQITSPLAAGRPRRAVSAPQARRLQMLAAVALATGAVLLAVVLVMRPTSPGPPSAALTQTSRAHRAAPVSARRATQHAGVHAQANRAARALKRRRAAAAELRRQAAAARRRVTQARSTPAPRRRTPVAPPAAPRRPGSPPPPAPSRRPSVSPVCVEFPPC